MSTSTLLFENRESNKFEFYQLTSQKWTKIKQLKNGNWATEFWKTKLTTCVGSEKVSGVKISQISSGARFFFLNFREANLKKTQ